MTKAKIPEGFQEWWDNYKHKVPAPKRNSVKHWALLGWSAHVDYEEQLDLASKEHDKKMMEEYQKAGCPPGWWGDPD
jgi:hypothetical protein